MRRGGRAFRAGTLGWSVAGGHRCVSCGVFCSFFGDYLPFWGV